MTKNIKEQYVSLLDHQRELLDCIVSSFSPLAERTKDPHEQRALDLLTDASRLVDEAAVAARNIPETDS